MTDQEIREIAEYFAQDEADPHDRSSRKCRWRRSRTSAAAACASSIPRPPGQTEPIGQRIIEVPEDEERVRHRDPNANVFIAYAPQGSVAKGKQYVESGGGGKSVNCTICHGADLMGLGNVPRLAGVHPIYLARQLFLFKDGARNGVDAQLMKKAVAQMTDQDVRQHHRVPGLARSDEGDGDEIGGQVAACRGRVAELSPAT